jgi:hypothetical protein
MNDEPWGITEHYDFKQIFENPKKIPEKEEEDKETWEFSRFRYHGMYALIDNEWVEPLAAWINKTLQTGIDSCYEVMAGRGWLAKALELQGVEIIATDDGSDYFHRTRDLQYEVIITDAVYDVDKMSANEVAEFLCVVHQEEDRRFIIIICYPPENNTAFEFITKLPKGTLIIYIGDGDFENTASIEFKNAVTWLDEPQNANHPDAFRLKDFPNFDDVQGVGNDNNEEKTIDGVIKLGVV